MASITIQNLDEDLMRRLRARAVEHGRSMEDEAQDILRQVVGQLSAPEDLGQAIHQSFAALGGVDLDLPARNSIRDAPNLE